MSEQTNPPAKPVAGQKKITIDLPKNLPAVYANVAFISSTAAELVLDFAQVLPRSPRGTVQARIIMTPMHAKLLHQALGQNLANYEAQYGPIRLPQRGADLANKFFRFPQEGSGEGKQEDE